LPRLIRKSKTRNYNRIRNKIDINELRDDFKFLTLSKRAEFVLFKNMYKAFAGKKLDLSKRTQAKTMPLVNIASFKSEIYKKSVKYRSSIIWNQLPKDWDMNIMEYEKFKNVVKIWIKEKRKGEYIYF